MSESMGKETKQNSSKSDKKNINHIDNSIESQTARPGSILEIKDLCFAYPEEEKRALNHISFQIKEGEFLVLCGKSGCGKSTLLKHIKTPLTPHGKRKGEILFDGKNLHEMTGREQSQRIGYVLQNPDNQIVTDKVWHELAFGLESLGYKSAEIRIRVAEMASYFGIQDWFYKNVAELLNHLFEKKNISKAALAKQSGMSEIYLHQIFAGRRNPSRNRLLCLCYGLDASVEETQELLRRCGKAQLYPKLKRDAIIYYGLLHKLDLFEINDKLFDENEETLF